MQSKAPKPKFIFGAATSSYQIEGAWDEDGKSPSIWDTFTARGKVKNKDTGQVACDHYHRYHEDVDIMHQMGLNAYRFSLAWSRILPDGYGPVNRKGADFYNRLIDTLLEKGIRPFVTLYHWDLPQILEDKGGWTSRDMIDWFTEYTAKSHELYGDRVKDWIILNEPFVFLVVGYLLGVHAPGKRGFNRFFKGTHNALLAQGSAARELRRLDSRANLGTTVSCTAAYPYRGKEKDLTAVKRFDAFWNRLYVDPVVGRGYPMEDLPMLKRLKKIIQPGDMEKINFDFDFWGINTYTTKLVKRNRTVPFLGYREIGRKLPRTEMGWEIDSRGIGDLLRKFDQYPEIKELYITENGAAMNDKLDNGKVHDKDRIEYLDAHLREVMQARKDGVNVNGYFAWSLLDNFEWAEGYRPRFGLVYVDYASQNRYIKDSGFWYKQYIENYEE